MAPVGQWGAMGGGMMLSSGGFAQPQAPMMPQQAYQVGRRSLDSLDYFFVAVMEDVKECYPPSFIFSLVVSIPHNRRLTPPDIGARNVLHQH